MGLFFPEAEYRALSFKSCHFSRSLSYLSTFDRLQFPPEKTFLKLDVISGTVNLNMGCLYHTQSINKVKDK